MDHSWGEKASKNKQFYLGNVFTPTNSKQALYQARLMRCLNLEQVSTENTVDILTLSVYCIEIQAGAVGGDTKEGEKKSLTCLKKVENCSRLRWVEVDNFEVALLLDCEEAGLKKIWFERTCSSKSEVSSFN